MRILVVDDDPAIVEILVVGLQRDGYEVRTATTGIAALHLAQEVVFDLAIIDIRLPDTRMDGIDVVRYLRQVQSHQFPIVLLTAHVVADAEMKPGLDAGANTYLFKPFRLAEVRACIHSLIADANIHL